MRESRLGLMFNAVLKIPMQFFILLLGALVFVFYQFVMPPLFFNEPVWKAEKQSSAGPRLSALESDFAAVHGEKQRMIERWVIAKRSGDVAAADDAHKLALDAHKRSEAIRAEVKKTISDANPAAKTNDTDYVFMTFVLHQLPHGLIGLLVAAIIAAALQSKAAELNALTSASIVDFYRHIIKREASDRHYVLASKCFTALWGSVAVSFALFANLTENLIQAANIASASARAGRRDRLFLPR